jgi:hypothetical protein
MPTKKKKIADQQNKTSQITSKSPQKHLNFASKKPKTPQKHLKTPKITSKSPQNP